MEKKKHYDHGEFDEAPKSFVANLMENPDDIVSATGATGLMQIPPVTPAEAQNYSELYAVPQQVNQVNPPKPDPLTK